MSEPSIIPIPPTGSVSPSLTGLTAAWLGAGPDCIIRSEAAGVRDHHAALERHADDWYLGRAVA